MELVDTDVLIDVQRGHPPAVAWFASLTALPAVPGLVVMELIQDARNMRELRKALRLVAPFQVVWPTAGDCTRALSDFAAYHLPHAVGLRRPHRRVRCGPFGNAVYLQRETLSGRARAYTFAALRALICRPSIPSSTNPIISP